MTTQVTCWTIAIGLLTLQLLISKQWMHLEANRWQEAMNAEIKALTDNDTFYLVPHCKDRQIVGAKWAYTIETNQNGEETYKLDLQQKATHKCKT